MKRTIPTVGTPTTACDGALIERTVNTTHPGAGDPTVFESPLDPDTRDDYLAVTAERDKDDREVYLAWLLRTEQALITLRKQVKFIIDQFGLEELSHKAQEAVEAEAQRQDLVTRFGVDLNKKASGGSQ